MFAVAFSAGLAIATCICGALAYATWRNPNNWHLDGDSGQVEFHKWIDIGIFGVIGALCLTFALLGSVL